MENIIYIINNPLSPQYPLNIGSHKVRYIFLKNFRYFISYLIRFKTRHVVFVFKLNWYFFYRTFWFYFFNENNIVIFSIVFLELFSSAVPLFPYFTALEKRFPTWLAAHLGV